MGRGVDGGIDDTVTVFVVDANRNMYTCGGYNCEAGCGLLARERGGDELMFERGFLKLDHIVEFDWLLVLDRDMANADSGCVGGLECEECVSGVENIGVPQRAHEMFVPVLWSPATGEELALYEADSYRRAVDAIGSIVS